MHTATRGGWTTATAIMGLLVLAGCAVLLGMLLQAKGLQYAADAADFVAVLLAILALVIQLVRWLRRQPVPTANQMDQAMETLADLVARQWRRETRARSLGDPEPMPVRWRLTERAVMAHPQSIMDSPVSFDGRSDRISLLTAQFRQLRCRRLVILGAPGSGKTTLAVQLVLELLATRQAGEPIPVLVSLAGWDPRKQPRLHAWLAERLVQDYPSLRAFGPDVARALAERGKILPILDGLDELPLPRQSTVIIKLNESLTETDQLVLTSRTTEYRTALAEANKVLTAAAVIEPEPLSPTQAADYLAACLPPDPGPSWQQVLDRLREGAAGHLATVLVTPLGLWLLRTVYIAPGADPAALLNSPVLRDPAALRAHLFDKLIPAVLATRDASRDPADTFLPRRAWNPEQVRDWLTYLAQHLHNANTPDMLWWHLAGHTLTARHVRLRIRLLSGLRAKCQQLEDHMVLLVHWLVRWLVFGPVFGQVFGPVFGPVFGQVFGPYLMRFGNYLLLLFVLVLLLPRLAVVLVWVLVWVLVLVFVSVFVWVFMPVLVAFVLVKLVFVLTSDVRANRQLMNKPAYANLKLKKNRTRLLARKLTRGLVIGLTFGLVVGPTIGSVVVGLIAGPMVGLMIGFINWVETPSRTDWATTPRSTYKATRTLAVLQTSAVGLLSVLAIGLLHERHGLMVGLMVGLTVLVVGLESLSSRVWFSYALALCWLAAARKLPLRLMDFLNDAYRLGLLRATGPAYQFRHAEFQGHLLQASFRQGTHGQNSNRSAIGVTIRMERQPSSDPPPTPLSRASRSKDV